MATMVASAPTDEQLQARVDALEAKHHGCGGSSNNSDAVVVQVRVVDDQMRRARSAVQDAGCYSSVWKWVPPSYYDWSLQERANFLQAPNVDHLCKSLLLENKKVQTSEEGLPMDRTNPQYILVVLQYAATLDVKKLCTAIRSMRKNVHERLDESQFDVRVASQEDNDRLTGYSHNSVTPFGLLQPEKILIVLSQQVVPLKRFWMGGGHVDLKLSVTVSDFQKSLNPVIADISQPRTGLAGGGAAGKTDTGGNVGVPGDAIATSGGHTGTGMGGTLAIGASGNLTTDQQPGGDGNAPPAATNEKMTSSKEKKHKKDKHKKKKHRSSSKKEKRPTGTPSSSSGSSASEESKTVGDGYVIYVDHDQTPDDHSAMTTPAKKKKKKKDKKKKKSKKKGSKDGVSAVVEESTTSSKSRRSKESSEDHSNSNDVVAASSPKSAQKADAAPPATTNNSAKSSNEDGNVIMVPTLNDDEQSPGKTHRFMQAPTSAPSLPKTSNSTSSSSAHIVDSDLQAIMARRRQMAEGSTSTESAAATGSATTPSSSVTRIKSPKKELKAFGMSSDLQAIMARRRRMAEGDNNNDDEQN